MLSHITNNYTVQICDSYIINYTTVDIYINFEGEKIYDDARNDTAVPRC